MNVDELIAELTKQRSKGYGNLPVRFYNAGGEHDVKNVVAYDADGNEEGGRVEVFLHGRSAHG